jgi:hypothetical protein
VTDAADDSTGEQQLGAWGESAAEPEWSAIDVEGEPAGPGSAEPGPPSQVPEGRPRRPSSLRAQIGESVNVPRRPLSPPPFPTPPAAADAEAPRTGGADATRAPAGGVQLQKRVESFVALVNERPEVGLGVAFVGGLILASILKRLAR